MNELQEMDTLFDRLFPILRSITGEGVRESLRILQEYIPLEVLSIKSGTQVFDWEIPKEWVIREAWIKDENENEIVNIKNNNLHVVNYSEPINQWMELDELKPLLHTIPHLPNAVPYVISYYSERWGFCLSHEQMENLVDGKYHVYINGELNYAHALLPGTSEKEILISTYLCHPTMANNELSGPIVSAFLYNRLKQWENREFTYRFVFIPETIGSIAYLHKYGDHLKENLYSGMVLTCLGGKGFPLNYKNARKVDSPLNRLIDFLVTKGDRNIHRREFTPIGGSDERQYCSPGFNLPVGQFSRMVYGQYEGYHNSLDTKEVMTIEALLESVNQIEQIIKLQEMNGYYMNLKPFGEPKLGKYNLYPDLNTPTNRSSSSNNHIDNRQQLNQILTLLNYSDGEHNLVDIVRKLNYPIDDYDASIEVLKKANLIEGPFYTKRSFAK